ncbi:MFS transporter [Nocardioides sp.]|uniref:MFS transporter n=1 Tax=Nocardioides sp. TaxID=35761 RepID=UPI003457392A
MTVGSAGSEERSYRWVILASATFAQAMACFFVQGLGALGGYLQLALSLNTFELGLLLSAAQLVPLVGLVIAGELLDRLGERTVVACGTALVGIALLAGSITSSYPWLLLALLVVGAGYSTAQPGGSKAVAGWFPANQRGLAMGIRQAGLPLGGAAAAASLPMISVHFGWQATLLFGGGVALLGAICFAALYRRPPESQSPEGLREVTRHRASRTEVLRSPAMRRIIAAGVVLITVQYGVLLLTALHLHHTVGLPLGQAAGFVVLAQVAGVVGRVALAAMTDHAAADRFTTVRMCMVACAVAIFALVKLPVESPWAIGGIVALLGFFGIGWYGPWVTYLSEVSPPGRQGFAIGSAMAFNQVAVVLAPPLLGLLSDRTGSYTTGWILLLLACVVGLSLTRTSPLVGRRSPATSSGVNTLPERTLAEQEPK